MAMPNLVCNEPIRAQVSARTPKTWELMLSPEIPGKRVLVEIQLNHGLAGEHKPELEQCLLRLYADVTRKFGQLHGENTRCFLVRAPESVDLVGLHIQEFGGATNGIACLETVFCVSPRNDGRVNLSHVDERFAPAEFGLHDGLPKARVIDWTAHAGQNPAVEWSAVVKSALQYYINRHKGPTGQLEVPLKGLNIVAGGVLPAGLATHSDTTLAAATLIAAMAASGEWGRVPLPDFCAWVAEAEASGAGRKSNIGTVLFGMAGEVAHIGWNPPRPKTHALGEEHAFLLAHTGKARTNTPEHGRMRATTTHLGFAYFHQAAVAALAGAEPSAAMQSDEQIYELLQQVPRRVTRSQALEQIESPRVRERLAAQFKTHPEPEDGYAAREKLFFVLAEMQRAQRARDAIRKGDAAEVGALMNAGQGGEAGCFHQVTAGGIVERTYRILCVSSDEELQSLADHGDALWRQSGNSGASSPDADLLCDLAGDVAGVLGARWFSPERVVILCRKEAVERVHERLAQGFYQPRKFDTGLSMRVYPCRGAGLLDV